MLSGGENWLIGPEYDDDLPSLSNDYDLAFRDGILRTLKAIGMSEESIEKGIEVHSGLWRDKLMRKAFNNKYHPLYVAVDFYIPMYEDRAYSSVKESIDSANKKICRFKCKLSVKTPAIFGDFLVLSEGGHFRARRTRYFENQINSVKGTKPA